MSEDPRDAFSYRVGDPVDVSHLLPPGSIGSSTASATPIFDALIRAWNLGAGLWRPPPQIPEDLPRDLEDPSA